MILEYHRTGKIRKFCYQEVWYSLFFIYFYILHDLREYLDHSQRGSFKQKKLFNSPSWKWTQTWSSVILEPHACGFVLREFCINTQSLTDRRTIWFVISLSVQWPANKPLSYNKTIYNIVILSTYGILSPTSGSVCWRSDVPIAFTVQCWNDSNV